MTGRFKTPYPGYEVLDKWETPSFNDATRRVIAERLENVPPHRFFTESEWAVLQAVCNRAIPQPERAAPVPIAPFIDVALHDGRGTGTRFADMPEDGAAWRRGLAALDAEAEAQHGRGFAALGPAEQDAILKAAADGDLSGSEWHGLPPKRFMRDVVLKAIVAIYYVHPAAQSEIGYGGPASPRGYVRLGANRRDGWEASVGDWDAVPPTKGGER